MNRVDSRARLAGPLLALLVGIACVSTKTTEDTVVQKVAQSPRILGFEANPAIIAPGDTAMLVWTTSDAVSIEIVDGAGNPVSIDGSEVAGGSVQVSPPETTSYKLTAHGKEGVRGPADRSVTVTVDTGTGAVDAPTIETFTAAPKQIAVGETVKLSWRTSNATALTLKDDAGVEVTLGDAPVGDGSVDVRPKRSTTTYTLIADGGGRRATARVGVAVDGLPRVHRFSVDPIEPVTAGARVRLLWETSRADTVVIEDDRNNLVVNTIDASGVQEWTVDRTTEFRITATGNGSEATAVTLARVGAEIVEFTASPDVARVGDPITLTWKTGGADAVVLTGPGDFGFDVPAGWLNAGSTISNLAESGDYVLHARLGDVVRTWGLFVQATRAPRIRSFTSPLSTITAAADHPVPMTLSYVQDGGKTCTLYHNGKAVPGSAGVACLPAGTIDINLTNTSALHLVAVNDAGSHEAIVRIDAVDPARISYLTKNPTRRLSPNDNTELAWKVTDAVRVWMKRDDTTFAIGETEFIGTRTIPIAADTVFTLYAENPLGEVTSLELPVLAGAPEIVEFEVEPRVAVPSDLLTFTWTCDGGDSLVLKAQDDTVVKTEDNSELIDHGTASIRAPATPTSLTYTLTVENSAPDPAIVSLELLVTDGPLVRSLTGSKSNIALGDAVDISWEVENDAAGNRPTLVLTDNFDNTYDLGGLDTNSGRVTIHPPEEGRHEFKLTATTDGTRPSSTDVDPVVVEVTIASKIVSFTADPSIVYTESGTVTPTSQLEWKTEDAVELWIFDATRAGVAIPPARLHLSLDDGASQAQLDAGRLDIAPLSTTRYLLRVANRIGASVEQTVTVFADPPAIVEFKPDVADLIVGETTTLRWDIENATVATIQPMSTVVTALPADPGRFVDISILPGAEQRSLYTSASTTTIDFPAGFRFPFDGRFFSQVRMTSNGFLSFDLGDPSASSSNGTFPTSGSYRYVHLAPFWDNLLGRVNNVNGEAWWWYDEVGRTITFMWKNWSYNYSTSGTTWDFNFEVMLYENGSFEYRYGNFWTSSTTSPYTGYAKGTAATIGYQDLSGTSAYTAAHNGNTIPDGPNNLGWFFDVTGPANGAREITPTASRSYMLSVANPDVVVSKETQVQVWQVPIITFTSIYPTAPLAQMPFTVSWQTSQATRVRLVDELGKILCEDLDLDQVSKGSCTLTLDAPGERKWQLEVINGIDRNLVTRPISFLVFPLLSIDRFHVSKPFANSGDPVLVTWEGRGAFDAELYECIPKTNRNNCTRVNTRGQDPNNGSYQTTATRSHEYFLRLVDRMSRAAEAWANVWVDIARIDQFTTSVTQTASGGNVTLTWSSPDDTLATLSGSTDTAADTIVDYEVPAPVEIDDQFIDISSTGTPILLTGTNADSGYFPLYFSTIPQGFTFPYFGKTHTGLSAKTDGYIVFDPTDTSTISSNTNMGIGSNVKIEIAPFWDNLTAGESGKLHWELRQSQDGRKFLIIQWTAFSFLASAAPTSNLNFQVLLWENGDIDFRYAAMSATGTNPNLADGASATIGIQAKNATWGQTVVPINNVVAGRLGNRSWRFSPAMKPDGQTVVKPTESTTYRLCVTNANFYETCEERRVVVIKPGALSISEIMVAPTAPAGEWFEVRNVSRDPISLAYFRLTSGPESFTIPEPFPIIQPNAFAVFARSASDSDNGGVSPAVVYGDGIEFTDSADDIALVLGGVVIDRVAWTSLWTIPANSSLTLDPSKFARHDETANDSRAGWCASPTVYGGGFYGTPGALGPGCLTGGAHDFYLLDPFSGMPWIDITNTGTELAGIWTDPWHSPSIPLGFKFPYFGDQVSEMTVLKHGAIALGPQPAVLTGVDAGSDSSAIPNATVLPNGLVAPMWDRMYNLVPTGTTPGSVRYELRDVGGVKVMVVQWHRVTPTFTTSSSNLATFQLQLWETGDIVFVYENPTPASSEANRKYTADAGACAVIGLENLAGDVAFQIFYYSGSGSCQEQPNIPGEAGRSYRFMRK